MYYCIYMLAYNTTYLSILPVLPTLFTILKAMHAPPIFHQTSQPGSRPGRGKTSNRLSCSSEAMQNSCTYIFIKTA